MTASDTLTLPAISAALVAAGVGQATAAATDWFIVFQALQDSAPAATKTIADRQICLYETPGLPPEERLSLDYPGVQVRVRGKPDDYTAVRAKLQDAFNALHSQEVAIGTEFVLFECQNSGPIQLGPDDKRRPHLAQNYRSTRQRP